MKKELATDDRNLNVYEFQYDKHCELTYSEANNFLNLHFVRTKTKSGDGINHQASFMHFYDPITLEYAQPPWATGSFDSSYQTASHSLSTFAMLTTDGKVTGLDLGDNYPRGIGMWNVDFSSDGKPILKNIYGFKTLHEQQAEHPSGSYSLPEYTEISTASTKFYQYSNDNQVYTELAASGFLEYDDGYVVMFLGENPALDNSKTGKALNSARNVGFIKVSKDL